MVIRLNQHWLRHFPNSRGALRSLDDACLVYRGTTNGEESARREARLCEFFDCRLVTVACLQGIAQQKRWPKLERRNSRGRGPIDRCRIRLWQHARKHAYMAR